MILFHGILPPSCSTPLLVRPLERGLEDDLIRRPLTPHPWYKMANSDAVGATACPVDAHLETLNSTYSQIHARKGTDFHFRTLQPREMAYFDLFSQRIADLSLLWLSVYWREPSAEGLRSGCHAATLPCGQPLLPLSLVFFPKRVPPLSQPEVCSSACFLALSKYLIYASYV